MNRRIIAAGVLCSLMWAFVTLLSFGLPVSWCRWIDQATLGQFSGPVFEMAHGFHYEVFNDDMPTAIFFVVFAAIFTLVFYVMTLVERGPAPKKTLTVIIFFSILFRFILWPGVMIHENDLYRYLWDGKVLSHGINPFKYAPADLDVYQKNIQQDFYDAAKGITIKSRRFTPSESKEIRALIALRDRNPVFFERIGHPQVPTIYPPVTQAIFALTSMLREDSILLMKLVFILFDIGVLFLIIKILRHLGREPGLALVYGWSPLVLKEIPNSGHYDPIVIFFMMLAVWAYIRRRENIFIVSLALSVLSKFFTLALLPIFRKALDRKKCFFFGMLIGLFYLPFILLGGTGIGVWNGLMVYNRDWVYNAGVFAVIKVAFKCLFPSTGGSLFFPKIVTGVIYLAVLVRLTKNKDQGDVSLLHNCFLALAALFILNPVADPWYFCWVIPFLCFFPYKSWILLSGLLILSYSNFHSDFVFSGRAVLGTPVVNFFIYIPFLAYWIFESFFQRKRYLP